MADIYHNAILRKPGAVFANADEANADRLSKYSPALLEAVDSMYADMLARGILLEPVSHEWDQETQTLTVVKKVSSKAAYREACIAVPSAIMRAAAERAGWIGVDGGWGPNGEERSPLAPPYDPNVVY